MLSAQDYRRLFDFQNSLISIDQTGPPNKTFLQKVMALLNTHLGYGDCVACFAGHQESTEPSVPSHLLINDGMDENFAYSFFTEYWMDNSFMTWLPDNEMELLSRTPNFTRISIFKKILQPKGYKDCLIKFIKQPGRDTYLSVLIFFSRSQFTERDIELIDMAAKSIGLAEMHAIDYNNLVNRVLMLKYYNNYFPLGIMLIENMYDVSYTNELAKEYLKEIGVTDERFYSSFYAQHIFGGSTHYAINSKFSKPIRIKNMLFNLVPMSNHHTALLDSIPQPAGAAGLVQREAIEGLSNISGCVYIIKDDTYHPQYSKITFESFGLTRQETVIAELIANGLSNKEIAEQEHISENTVKVHTSNIFRKMEVNNRAKMVAKLNESSRQSPQ